MMMLRNQQQQQQQQQISPGFNPNKPPSHYSQSPDVQIQQLVQHAKMAQTQRHQLNQPDVKVPFQPRPQVVPAGSIPKDALLAQKQGVITASAAAVQRGMQAAAIAASPPRPAVVDSGIALERIIVPAMREKPFGPLTLAQFIREQEEAHKETTYSKNLRIHRDNHITVLKKRKKEYEQEREDKIRHRMSAHRFRYHKMGSREASQKGALVQLMYAHYSYFTLLLFSQELLFGCLVVWLFGCLVVWFLS
jgi:hypothetical protein